MRTLWFALLLGNFCMAAHAVTVTATPSTCSNVTGVGTKDWSSPANALTQDTSYATVAVDDGEVSRYLQCSGYGFSIPIGSTIDGITVTVRRWVDNAGGSPQDSVVQLLKSGVVQGTNNATATVYPTTVANASYGGATNKWGSTWTVANINATNFGVAFASQKASSNGGARTVSVDVISVAVDYTPAPTASAPALASLNPTTGAGSVSWIVAFSQSVTGVDASDFALVQAGGVSGASIISVNGSGTSWTVTATTGTGTGSLGLNVVDNDSIVNAGGNPLGGAGTGNGNVTGAVYSVTDFVCSQPNNIPAGLTLTCVCDTFKRATLNPSTIFGSDWIVSTSDGTGIVPSIVNSGYLRLTNNTGNNAKAAAVPAAFPGAGNYISVEFRNHAYNGSGADGVAIILSDYAVPPVPGAFGGSLGYAQKTGISGFAGGWIGVGLDEFGNYQSASEGRVGGPGVLADTVAVRGSGSGSGGTAYPWLQGNATALSPGIDSPASTVPAPGHMYQVIVDGRNSASNQAFVQVNRDTTGTGNSYTQLFAPFDAFARATSLGYTQAPVPSNWQLSFTGSTGGSTNIHEIGSVRICAQTIVPPTGGVASGFSAIDEAYGTPALAVQNYLTGRIYTKVAGTAFKLNIAAINNSQIQTGYVLTGTKDVTVKLVDNSDGVCVLNSAQTNYCSAACKAKTAVVSQILSFASSNSGQMQSADFTVSRAYSNLAAIISDSSTTACSTDAFAVRPLAFSSVSSTATNATLTGTPVFKAGTDTFSMTVATNTLGYAGSAAVPTINPTGVAATASGWTAGTINPAQFPVATTNATNSQATGSSFTYSEVGNFKLLGYNPSSDTTSARGVYDSTWTAVDQGTQTDCIAGSYANARDTSGSFGSNTNYGKFGCLFGITADTALMGRFVPDHFTMITKTVAAACTGAGQNFTYMGQPALGISYKLEARNGSDVKTVNYSAAAPAYPVVAPTLVAEDQAAGNQGCDIGSRIADAPVAVWTGGVYDATTAAASFKRPTVNPPVALSNADAAACTSTVDGAGGPFAALDIGVQMVDGTSTLAGLDMNASTSGVCPTGGACNAKKLGATAALLGRLKVLNAYGSELLPMRVPVRVEFFNAGVWALNTNDTCTTLATGNVAGVAPTSITQMGSTSPGVATIVVPKQAPGSVDMALNLGAGAADVSCNTAHPASTGANLSWLGFAWCSGKTDPNARIRFGSPKSSFIYLRERY